MIYETAEWADKFFQTLPENDQECLFYLMTILSCVQHSLLEGGLSETELKTLQLLSLHNEVQTLKEIKELH